LHHDVTVFTNGSIGSAEEGNQEPFPVIAEGSEPRSMLEVVRRRRQVMDLLRAEQPSVLLVGDPSAHEVCSLVPGHVLSRCWPIFYGSELLNWEGLLRRHSPLPARFLKGHLIRRYLTSAEGTICISRYTAGVLSRLIPGVEAGCIVYPTVSDLVLRLPPQATLSIQLRRRLAPSGHPPTILLTVARISARKNQLGVLEVMAHLHRSSTERFHYVIVGNVDAPQHARYLDQMKVYMQKHGLEEAVTFVPNASDEEKVAYLDACDIFVMLSRTVGTSVEGFGISPVEASCRGKPVIVSDHGGMPETIVEGHTGYAVNPDDTEAVASRLLALVQDNLLRERLGEAGREFARREFTPEVSARRLHEFMLTRGITRDR
jgi:phosphatidylinositol alpha-1,6-mannosyltransferase